MDNAKKNGRVCYGLVDPRDGTVRYIGCTKDLRARLAAHCKEARRKASSPKDAWINELRDRGLRPSVLVLEEVSTEDWGLREKYWVAQYRPTGLLLNRTDGGMGMAGWVCSDEFRARVSDTLRRRLPISEETRQKIRLARSKHPPLSAEGRAKMRAAKLNLSAEARANMSRAQRARPPKSEETLRKMSTRVRCVETGETYKSITAAAAAVGISQPFMSYIIKHNRPHNGNHYVKEDTCR